MSSSNPINQYLGEPVFIRTVTHHYTGRLTQVSKQWLVLNDAAWIPDNGRFANFLDNGTPNEVEPYSGSCMIGVGAVLDVSRWNHDLPRDQK